MEATTKIKYIYTKKPKEKYLKSKNTFENSSKIKEFFKNYLLYQTKEDLQSIFTQKNYIKIYNYLFLINNTQEYIDIYSFINETLIELLNKIIKIEDENKDEIEKIINIVNYIDIMDKKVKNLKAILTTCVSRFNAELIKSMNDKMNIFTILNQTNTNNNNNNFTKFIDISQNIFLNLLSKENDEKEKQKIINSIYQFIKILKIVSNKNKINSFYEKIFELMIKMGKYNTIYEDISKKLDGINENNNFESNIISNYFDLIYKEAEKDYIILKKIFGDKDAIKYKERIIQIYIFDKLIKQIFKNEKLLKIIISEKKYDILKFIEAKTRHSLKLTREFTNSVFNLLLKEYQNKIILPKDKINIKEGIIFIEQMLLNIKELNNIFNEVFNQNRKMVLQFQETLLKLISSKNIQTLEYFLSIYVNENIYNDNIRNNLLLDKPFIQLLTNRNNKEIFFNYYKKYIIKRISNNNFNLDTEIIFEKFLKKNIENRYMVPISRLFKDIEETKFINANNTNQNYFYLFSYDALDTQYDLLQIIDDTKNILNPFKSQMNIYNEKYPKRKITLSQILSTIELSFLNKYNLLVNYIQWYILQIISQEKNNNYSITYEKLSSSIPYKPENKTFLKVYINSLIDMNILIKEEKNVQNNNDINLDDVLKINFNYQNKINRIICFIKPNNIIKGMIKKMNNFENDKNEKEKEDYNRNYRAMAVVKNIKHIIDCIIMQITKALPKGENISEKELIINTIKHQIIQDLGLSKNKGIDTPLIKERLSSLVERNFIQIHSTENSISYSYF